MQITEIRVKKLAHTNDRVQAFATVVFDDMLAINSIRIIKIDSHYIVAMPNREVKYKCKQCPHKNNSGASYCSHCGAKLTPVTGKREFTDYVCPLSPEIRRMIEDKILQAFFGSNEQSLQT